ncbi:MAG TPA: VOC family protein [Micromonospora sp.]|nr:VOC family protein [Micromonospora sp.]
MALTATMLTIDCADPTRLATFWSEAAGRVRAERG